MINHKKQLVNVFLHNFLFVFGAAMQLCCPVKLVGPQTQAVGENEVLPHYVFSLCLQIVSEINPRLVYVFKLFKLPSPVKTSFPCIINAVTRCSKCDSLICYRTIQFPAAPPTSYCILGICKLS